MRAALARRVFRLGYWFSMVAAKRISWDGWSEAIYVTSTRGLAKTRDVADPAVRQSHEQLQDSVAEIEKWRRP